METFNFVSKFEDYQIPIQIIKLKDSFFVYVGNSQFNFNNLIISSCFTGSNNNEHSVSSCTILDDEYSEIGKSLSEKLSMGRNLNF